MKGGELTNCLTNRATVDFTGRTVVENRQWGRRKQPKQTVVLQRTLDNLLCLMPVLDSFYNERDFNKKKENS
jgi:hypothetical protein